MTVSCLGHTGWIQMSVLLLLHSFFKYNSFLCSTLYAVSIALEILEEPPNNKVGLS
jgi:hypothetical protein